MWFLLVLTTHGNWLHSPMGVGAFLRCKAYKPIKVGSMQPDAIVAKTEELIRSGVK